MFGDGAGKHAGGVIEGGVPIGTTAGQAFAQAQCGIQRSRAQVTGQMQGRALAAQFAEVGRVGWIAADAEDALAVVLDQHAAADPAVTTGGRSDLAVHQATSRVGPALPKACSRVKEWPNIS